MPEKTVLICDSPDDDDPGAYWDITSPDGGTRRVILCVKHAKPFVQAIAWGKPAPRRPKDRPRPRRDDTESEILALVRQ